MKTVLIENSLVSISEDDFTALDAAEQNARRTGDNCMYTAAKTALLEKYTVKNIVDHVFR
jgi:hypothetical protein|nr:MAG TPA: hypothetical protein [Caudoviricetes sp.]